jgi:hypothetical protein
MARLQTFPQRITGSPKERVMKKEIEQLIFAGLALAATEVLIAVMSDREKPLHERLKLYFKLDKLLD